MNREERKVCSLQMYTLRKRDLCSYSCSCGICIIYFISINPFICIIQGSPAKAIPCHAIPFHALRHLLKFTKFLHHLTFHSTLYTYAYAHTNYSYKNRRREAKKASLKRLISCSNRFGSNENREAMRHDSRTFF